MSQRRKKDNWKMGLLIGLFFGLGVGLVGFALFLKLGQRGMIPSLATESASGSQINSAELLPTPTLLAQGNAGENPSAEPIDTDSTGELPAETEPSDPPSSDQQNNQTDGVLSLTEQQISERLLIRIREMGILKGEDNGVILQNGIITFYDVQTFLALKSRTEVVATVQANNGQPEVTILKADMSGVPLPDSIQQEVKTNFQAVMIAELQSMINYTYIDEITINDGEMVIRYH